MKIKSNGNEYSFRDSLTFKEYMYFQDNYPGETGVTNEKWWIERSTYGEDFLKTVHKGSSEDLEITDENWKDFYPVFLQFFPTPQEYYVVLNNVSFLNKGAAGVIENTHFLRYMVMKEFGNLTIDKLSELPVKEALMLYYYVINNKLIEMYGIDIILEQGQEKQDINMFG